MSLVGRALRRASQPQNGPSLLPDVEEAAMDLHPEAVAPTDRKQGVLLEDLLRSQPSAIRPDLDWAPPGSGGTQTTNNDDIDLVYDTADLKVDPWPAADPSSSTSQATSEQSSPAPEPATSPPDHDDVNAVTVTPARRLAWAMGRQRLFVVIGLATVGLAVTGGIIAMSALHGTAPSPASQPRPSAEQVPAMRPVPLAIDSRTPSNDTKPNARAAAKPAPAAAGPKRGTLALSRTGVGKSKLSKPTKSVKSVKKNSASVPSKLHASTSAPRSPAPLPRELRSPDSAPVTVSGTAKGAFALYNEGARLQKTGDRDAAASAYVQALAEDPSLIEAHNNLGVLRMHGGDTSGAEKSLQAAIALNSRYGPAYANLGRLYIQQRRSEEAELMLLRAASLMPANASVRNNLALLYQQLGRDEDEANAWRSALALGSEDAAVHYNLGVHYQRLGEPALARTHFEKALATDDRRSAAYRESARRALANLNTR